MWKWYIDSVTMLKLSDQRERRALGGQDHPRWSRGQSSQPQRVIFRSWNLREFALLSFNLPGTSDPTIPSIFLPFRTSILCMSHYCILKADACFLVSQVCGWRFCSMMDHIQNFTHTWFRWQNLNWYSNEIWNFPLMMEWVNTFGNIGMEWMYFPYRTDVNLVGQKVDWVE